MSQHTIGNFDVTIDGDRASSKVHFYNPMGRPKSTERCRCSGSAGSTSTSWCARRTVGASRSASSSRRLGHSEAAAVRRLIAVLRWASAPRSCREGDVVRESRRQCVAGGAVAARGANLGSRGAPRGESGFRRGLLERPLATAATRLCAESDTRSIFVHATRRARSFREQSEPWPQVMVWRYAVPGILGSAPEVSIAMRDCRVELVSVQRDDRTVFQKSGSLPLVMKQAFEVFSSMISRPAPRSMTRWNG